MCFSSGLEVGGVTGKQVVTTHPPQTMSQPLDRKGQPRLDILCWVGGWLVVEFVFSGVARREQATTTHPPRTTDSQPSHLRREGPT